jgi:DNA replication protein DnaC
MAAACPFCRDSGWVAGPALPLDDPRFGHNAVPCRACDIILPWLAPSLPWNDRARYGVTTSDATAETLAAVTEWVAGGSGALPFLVVDGDIGVGKTHLALVVCFLLAEESRVQVGYGTAKEILDGLKRTFSDPTRDAELLLRRIAAAPVLCVDDLGAENATAWAQSEILDIVDHRYAAWAPTIITTNLDPADRRATGRLWSRVFGDRTLRVSLEGPDRRKRPLREARS